MYSAAPNSDGFRVRGSRWEQGVTDGARTRDLQSHNLAPATVSMLAPGVRSIPRVTANNRSCFDRASVANLAL